MLAVVMLFMYAPAMLFSMFFSFFLESLLGIDVFHTLFLALMYLQFLLAIAFGGVSLYQIQKTGEKGMFLSIFAIVFGVLFLYSFYTGSPFFLF